MFVVIKIPTQTIRQLPGVKFRRKLTDTSITLLNILKKRLRGHPNIVQFYSAASLNEKETEHGMSEFLILTELCSGKMFFYLCYKKRVALFTVDCFSFAFQDNPTGMQCFVVSVQNCLTSNLDYMQTSD